LVGQKADIDAKDFEELEKVYTGFMEDVAERAGKLDEFKSLDVDYAVFKSDMKDLKKVLDASDEATLREVLKETKFDTGNFLKIMDQDPKIIEQVRAVVFKSAFKKAKRGVEQDLNFNSVSNFLDAFPEEVGAKILGQENNAIIQRWLEAGKRSGVFLDLPTPKLSLLTTVSRLPAKDIAQLRLPPGAAPKRTILDVLSQQITEPLISPKGLARRGLSVGARRLTAGQQLEDIEEEESRRRAEEILQLGQ